MIKINKKTSLIEVSVGTGCDLQPVGICISARPGTGIFSGLYMLLEALGAKEEGGIFNFGGVSSSVHHATILVKEKKNSVKLFFFSEVYLSFVAGLSELPQNKKDQGVIDYLFSNEEVVATLRPVPVGGWELEIYF